MHFLQFVPVIGFQMGFYCISLFKTKVTIFVNDKIDNYCSMSSRDTDVETLDSPLGSAQNSCKDLFISKDKMLVFLLNKHIAL